MDKTDTECKPSFLTFAAWQRPPVDSNYLGSCFKQGAAMLFDSFSFSLTFLMPLA